MSLFVGANFTLNRRHYATALKPDPWVPEGSSGLALCSTAGRPVVVYDQRYFYARSLASQRPGTKRVSDAPMCSRCARIAAQEGTS